jgi:hypothetical protein
MDAPSYGLYVLVALLLAVLSYVIYRRYSRAQTVSVPPINEPASKEEEVDDADDKED